MTPSRLNPPKCHETHPSKHATKEGRGEKEVCRLTAEEVQDVVAAVRVAVDPVLNQNLQILIRNC